MTMPLKSNAMHWGTLAKTFHWAIVALLIRVSHVARRQYDGRVAP